VSHRAAVAWRKRNVFWNIPTKGNCGPRQELGAARIRMTLCAKVARRKEYGLQRKGKDAIAPRTPKGCTCRMKLWKDPAGKIRIEDPDTKRQLCLKTERTSEEINRKVFKPEVVKRAVGMSSGL
jgi:hypothetical protein